MILLPRSRRFPHLAALRGAGGFPLLLLCACSVGIDDRPVPPEAIPSAAYDRGPDAGTYGMPAASAGPIVRAAAPAYSGRAASSGGGGTMVWQTGAQPVAMERTSPATPEAETSEVASAPAEEATAEAQPTEAAGAEEPAAGQAAEPAQARTFRLAPFVGLDAGAAAPLRDALRAEAERAGIGLSDGPEKLVLKGYLSSMEDGGAKTLNYVWDVYDTSGNRLTRIDGQQKLPRNARTEPLSLDPGTAGKVAARAVEALARWRPDEAT